MAYPYVFEHGGDVYLVPDTPGRGVTLYRAEHFPDGWRFAGTLIADPAASDASMFERGGAWWLFTGRSTGAREMNELHLYQAPAPTGPWRPHPANPVHAGASSGSRPAGRVAIMDGRLIRFAQDGRPRYGSSVLGYEITRLSETDYAEQPLAGNPLLRAGRAHWNSGGMHHIDPVVRGGGGYLACVDGWYAS
jgi:hypothetical protein